MAADLYDLRAAWEHRWPEALALWSKFTRLSAPRWCLSDDAARREGLTESFAMIRLTDQAVVINLALVDRLELDAYGLEIMGHEIGHHVYCPADLNDNARMIARMRWALPTREHLANLIGNLYTDLLINDRLQRSASLKLSEVYQHLVHDSGNRMWTLYMRMYEILWSLQQGTLAAGALDARMQGDAQLGARLVRVFARDWLEGAGRFAALCLPYLMEDNGAAMESLLRGWRDTSKAGAGGAPDGLVEIEPGEHAGAIHPSLDPALTDVDEGDGTEKARAEPQERDQQGGSTGQSRQPFEYGELLKALGLDLDDHEIAVRYYRERAQPHLIRFPTRVLPPTSDSLPEGLEPWDIGQPLEDADWTQSVMVSPRIVPGVTTVQRVWGTSEGTQPERQPFDLDLYVDSSGSMANPQIQLSYLTLAGAIIVLSALRAGARVQATLWSDTGQFETTKGFIRDEHKLLQILTGYIGGGTAFPIHILRDTFQARKTTDRPAHILVISDDGVTTMFDKDEKGNSGWEMAQMALDRGRGGGTLALNLYKEWEQDPALARAHAMGWEIYRVRDWAGLVEFARQFAARRYGE
ncbi:MAG: VWA domain-containing protein [Anaerolineae bacterium]